MIEFVLFLKQSLKIKELSLLSMLGKKKATSNAHTSSFLILNINIIS